MGSVGFAVRQRWFRPILWKIAVAALELGFGALRSGAPAWDHASRGPAKPLAARRSLLNSGQLDEIFEAASS